MLDIGISAKREITAAPCVMNNITSPNDPWGIDPVSLIKSKLRASAIHIIITSNIAKVNNIAIRHNIFIIIPVLVSLLVLSFLVSLL